MINGMRLFSRMIIPKKGTLAGPEWPRKMENLYERLLRLGRDVLKSERKLSVSEKVRVEKKKKRSNSTHFRYISKAEFRVFNKRF